MQRPRKALQRLDSAPPAIGQIGCDSRVRSTVGRPRRTTNEAVKIILEWHAQYCAWRAQRPVPSIRQLARELGMSTGTVSDVIRRRGRFSQASPEERAAVQRKHSRRLRAIARDRDYER